MAFTNRGAKLLFDTYFRAASAPSTLYLALCTNSTPPTVDSKTMADVSQIATGNGYSDGGQAVARNTTDFDSLVEDDTDNQAELQLKDFSWTAAGGSIPASGSGARWAVLTTDEATVANRQIIAYWDLGSDRSVSITQTLTLPNLELRGTN